MRTEGIKPGKRVDVTTHMITHDLVIQAFTYQLECVCTVPPSQTNKMHSNY